MGPPVIADFLDRKIVTETHPLAIRRSEDPAQVPAFSNRSRVELIERTDKKLRAVIADVDRGLAIRGYREAATKAVNRQRGRPYWGDREALHAPRSRAHGEPHKRAADGGSHQGAGRQRCDAPPQRSVRPKRCRRKTSCDDCGLVIDYEECHRDVSDPLAAILDEAPLQQRSDRLRHVRRENVPVRFEADHRAEHLRHVLAVKGASPRQHLVQHAAEGPDVAPLVSLSSFRLLRGHIRRGSEDDARAGQHGGARDGRRLRPVGRARRVLLGCQRLREPEVQHLHRPVRAQLDVRRLEIAMDDALLVRGFKSFRDLFRYRQCFVERDRPASNALGQIVALDEFHHERTDTVGFFETVDVRDVGMIQRRESLRFAREPREPFRVAGEQVGQYLHRDLAIELRIARTEYLAHPAYADAGDDVVDAEARAGRESQTAGSITVSVAGTRSILCDAAGASDSRHAFRSH